VAVSRIGTEGRTAVDGRTTRHDSYRLSQRKRKLIEEAFGWAKTIAGLAKVKVRGLDRVRHQFTFTSDHHNSLWRDFPKTATEFEARFATEEDCRAYWIEARWGGKPASHDRESAVTLCVSDVTQNNRQTQGPGESRARNAQCPQSMQQCSSASPHSRHLASPGCASRSKR
jgi:hypothetical protein